MYVNGTFLATALKSCSGGGLLFRGGNNLGASSRFSPQGCSREGRELLMLSAEENRTKILTADWKTGSADRTKRSIYILVFGNLLNMEHFKS